MRYLKTLLVALFFIPKLSFCQKVDINYSDTNYIFQKKHNFGINYSIKTRRQSEWSSLSNVDTKIFSLFLIEAGEKRLIFKFTDSLHNKIIETEFFMSQRLKTEYELSTFMCIDSQFVDDYQPVFYKVLINKIKLKNGNYRCYYENGNEKEEGVYKSDSKSRTEFKVGKWIFYHENGNIRLIENYVQKDNICLLGSSYTEFYSNGKLKIEGSYNADLANKSYLDSIWCINMQKDIWTGGIKDGVWNEYDEKGKLIKKEIYRNGELLVPKKKRLKKEK